MPAQFAPYGKLLKRAREIARIASAAELLTWDIETCMHPKALTYRAEQMAQVSVHTHLFFTAKKVGKCVLDCKQHGFAPNTPEAANVLEWRRRYDRAPK